MNSTTIAKMESLVPVRLDQLTKEELKSYFENSWNIYDILFSAITSDETLYKSPDPLRNPLIFYLGHTAAFYINKLVMAGILEQGLNPYFEEIFARGVDPDLPENLDVTDIWPKIAEVRAYRKEVYNAIIDIIDNQPLNLPIDDKHLLWSLMMGIEHDRIHFETSSVLIRQLAPDLVERPEGWEYAPTFGKPKTNQLISVEGGTARLGKAKEAALYGWDNEYGSLEVEVQPFAATQNLVSNHEFLAFVQAGGYHNENLWTEEGWKWKNRTNANHPKFWILTEDGFDYRAMFDVLPMPLDWPAEVNAHEAWAYCTWKGEEWRLLSEAEFSLISTNTFAFEQDPVFEKNHNLNMHFGSPTPVGYMNHDNSYGFNDLFGNVWDWLRDDFYPLPGFEVHHLYEDFSAPYFDEDHSMLLGGAWATTGTGASKYYRLWFRRHFFQHAGFRLAKDLFLN